MRAVVFVVCAFSIVTPIFAQQVTIADPPEVRGPFTLTATYDFAAGHNAFAFNGNSVPPLIRMLPGGLIKLHYVNKLPVQSDEMCAVGRCTNVTNLHFHGLQVSPGSPKDDVLTMMAMPGEALDYKVEVPSYAAPGLYWYHTHPHGESARQDLDVMSGAIIVEGIDQYYPQLRNMRERVLILRDQDLEHSSASGREEILRKVEVTSSICGTAREQKRERIFTLNGEIRPRIPIGSGEPQFWRIVNASPDLYADLQLSGGQFEIVALDGMPLSYHDPHRSTRRVDHVLVPPAGRVEAIVIGPTSNSQATLSSRCVDTGPDGDANPAMVIADVGAPGDHSAARDVLDSTGPPAHDKVTKTLLHELEVDKPDFTVTFTEDKNGFYINGRKFSMQDQPLVRVRVGGIEHWRIVNATREVHPLHIHQIHFLAYAENAIPSDSPEWLDTVNVPYGGTVDLIMDFTDRIIRGMSLFHCHLLSHEDKGTMAKILFE
jgi:FtsP/CotA-like multicopper oxidase with cupredoxin domain